MKNLFIVCFSIVLLLSGCKDNEVKDKKASLQLVFKGKYNGGNFVLKNTKINTGDATANIQLLKFYLSNITLVKNDGTEVLAKDITILNFENNHNTDNNQGETITMDVPEGDYKAIKFGLGVDSSKNNADPTVYKEGEPLSVFEGMHWNWNTGYIFLKIEGKYDTLVNAVTLPKSYFYHIGLNDLYQTVAFNKNFTLTADNANTLKFNIDMAKVFSGTNENISMKTENFTHTTGQISLATKVRNLFLDAIILE